MSKILNVEIRNCLECPYLIFDNNNLNCEYPDRYDRVIDPTSLPDWCPLPDAKEEVK